MLTDKNIEDLTELGVTVVPSVLSETEIVQAELGFWSWLDQFSDGYIKRDDPSTWIDSKQWPFSQGMKGIIQNYKSLIHSQEVWNVRQNPKVVQIFTDLWDVKPEELLCSFDGVNIQRPPELTGKYSDILGRDWHHMDQGSKKIGLCTIQGFVNLIDTDIGDGCLVIRPGSHKYHEEFHATFPEFKDDWVKLQDIHHKWFDDKGCETIRITAPRGSMTLWDSRAIHANSTAQPGREHPDRFRMVIYICMTTRDRATESTLAKKRKYFLEGRVTNHYPHCIKVFPIKPHLYGNTTFLPGLEKDQLMYHVPELTELGRKLAGFS